MPAPCIGILGGGQLAKMSLLAASRLGISVAIIDKEKNSPAGRLTKIEFTGNVNNKKLLLSFASKCDVITLENEFIDPFIAESLEKAGNKVTPSSKTISLIQDKLVQKKLLQKNNLPVPEFIQVEHLGEFNKISSLLSLPFILKSRKMGYDGYGNALVKNEKDFKIAFLNLTRRHSKLMAEKFIKFRMELAVMIARTKKETVVYPVVQTIQKNHICHTVIAPARINKNLSRKVQDIAKRSAKASGCYGLLGIELFLTGKNEILINELAPRPHNSGHYTIEGCYTSQFENHVRSVLELPLGSAEMIQPYAVMVNILGKRNKMAEVHYNKILKRNLHLHIYGKQFSRVGRKMGHITVTGNNLKKILKTALDAEKEFII